MRILGVVKRTTKVTETPLHGILPRLVAVGIEVFVDLCIRFLDFCFRTTGKGKVESLKDVPFEREVAVPCPVLAEGCRQCGEVARILKVTLLKFVVVTIHVGRESDALGSKSEVLRLNDVEPLTLSLEVFKRFPRFPVGAPRVVNASLPVQFALVNSGLSFSILCRAAITESKVGRVVRHWMLASTDIETNARKGEVSVCFSMIGEALQRVALLSIGKSIKRIAKEHIRIEGIVLGRDFFLAVTIVHRNVELRLFGQEATKVELCGNGIVEVVLILTLGNALLNSTKTRCYHLGSSIYRAQVADLYLQASLCCPTSVIAEFLEAQLVCPNLNALRLTTIVANTNHDGLDLSKRRITHNGDTIVRMVFIISGEEAIHGSHSYTCLSIALLFERSEEVEIDVNHIFRRPNSQATGSTIGVVVAWSRNLQGHFVFVVVALVVRTKTQKDTAIPISSFRDIFSQSICVDVHLQVFVLTHIVVAVLINRLCLTSAKIASHHTHGLFVSLNKLRLRGVGNTSDARGQDIVDGLLVVVFFNADGTYFQRSTTSRSDITIIERLLIGSPITLHKVESGKTKNGLFLESRHEDTHEANARKVADVAFLILVFCQRNAEKIPGTFFRITITKLHACSSLVGNVVATNHHIFRTNTNSILIILLVFVEGIVLIDILHIGRYLPSSFITLWSCIRIGTIALRHVDTLIAIQDRHLKLVEIRTAIVVVVIVSRVIIDAIENSSRHFALYLLQVVGIKFELSLFIIIKAIKADVLSRSCSCFVIESISHAATVRKTSPITIGIVLRISIDGHSALEILLSVLEDILRHFTKIEVKVAAMIARQVVLVDEGVHHPELYVFDVLSLEICIVEFAHHTAPSLFRMLEMAVLINICGEVVGTTLLWIESKVQDVKTSSTCIVVLRLLRIKLTFIDLAYIMAGKLVEVTLDVAGG